MTKKDIIISLLSAIPPIVGTSIISFIMSRKYGDLKEVIKYILLGLPITLGTTYYLFVNVIPKYADYFLLIPAIIPLPMSFLLTRRNMTISYSEDYIEIKFKIPINMTSHDPHELFNYVFNKALNRIRNPYYYYKLSGVSNCSGLKVSYLNEDKLVIRRKCGDIDIRIVISSKKIADMVIDISY
ncbi:hypothetical protein V6M85_11900 [Sulfolobus tengchongensis]|uniref:Uncharacterized protein n=1 Tax=Sulfolobus tengchongensis TaxID=207809 RepID=A0AAX4L1Q6_9CREN